MRGWLGFESEDALCFSILTSCGVSFKRETVQGVTTPSNNQLRSLEDSTSTHSRLSYISAEKAGTQKHRKIRSSSPVLVMRWGGC